MLLDPVTNTIAVTSDWCDGVKRWPEKAWPDVSVVGYVAKLIDFAHFAYKLFPDSHQVVRLEETRDAAKKEILEARRFGAITKDAARELYEGAGYIEETGDRHWVEVPDALTSFFGSDFKPVTGPSVHHQFMIDVVLPALQEGLREYLRTAS